MHIYSFSEAAAIWVEALGAAEDLKANPAEAELIVSESAELPADLEAQEVFTFSPQTLKQMLDAVLMLGKRIGRLEQAMSVLAGLEKGIQSIHNRIGYTRGMDRAKLPAVLCLRSLEPPVPANRWMPDVVEKAGGRLAVEGDEALSWEKMGRLNVEILIVASTEDTLSQMHFRFVNLIRDNPDAARTIHRIPRIFVFDARTYFRQPSPAIYQGITLLASIFHPEKTGPLEAFDAYIQYPHQNS